MSSEDNTVNIVIGDQVVKGMNPSLLNQNVCKTLKTLEPIDSLEESIGRKQ
jgi:hypothetical protein